ncbi:hypothetical protein LCGC14_2155920, partial [marine sediment metagenome]
MAKTFTEQATELDKAERTRKASTVADIGEAPPPTAPVPEPIGEAPEPPPKLPELSEKEEADAKRAVTRAAEIGEVIPKAITAKFPGEKPPFPIGFTAPEGTVSEVDAKGRPTVIKTSAGLLQFTPNSTMFKIGFLTSADYARTGALADNPVAAADFLPMTSETGRPLLIAKEVAFKLQNRSPKDQFQAMQEMGIIKSGSRFIAAKNGEWTFETAVSVRRGERVAKEREVFITQSQVAEQFDQSQRLSNKFIKEHIKLPDGNWVDIKDWNKLDDKFQTIGIRQGFDKMSAAIDKDAKDFRDDNTELPGGAWMANEDLLKIKSSNPALHTILTDKGFQDYQEAIDDAKDTLADFH